MCMNYVHFVCGKCPYIRRHGRLQLKYGNMNIAVSKFFPHNESNKIFSFSCFVSPKNSRVYYSQHNTKLTY